MLSTQIISIQLAGVMAPECSAWKCDHVRKVCTARWWIRVAALVSASTGPSVEYKAKKRLIKSIHFFPPFSKSKEHGRQLLRKRWWVCNHLRWLGTEEILQHSQNSISQPLRASELSWKNKGNNNLLNTTAHGMNLSVPHTALDLHLGDIERFERFGYCCSLPGADLPLSSSLFLLPVGLLQEQFSGKTWGHNTQWFDRENDLCLYRNRTLLVNMSDEGFQKESCLICHLNLLCDY